MDQSVVTLLGLPNELLLRIFKNLSNIDVLYSLFEVDHHQLHTIVLDKTFTESLNFVNTINGDLWPIGNFILDRLCTNILPKIGCKITSLTLHAKSMEAILLADDYPNLIELKLFCVTDKIASRYLTGRTIYVLIEDLIHLFHLDQSPFRRLFQEQIRDLILLCKHHVNAVLTPKKTKSDFCTCLRARHLPSSTCSSSTIRKLNVHLDRFEDCLALLDGRLNQLTTLIVTISSEKFGIRKSYKRVRVAI